MYRKKIQTNTGIESSEYESIVVHTTQHVKFLTKSVHNSCFHTVLLLSLAFKSSKIAAYALDNELTRDRNNYKCRSTSSNCDWTSSHISPFTQEGSWDKCKSTCGCPITTDGPATSQAITPQSMLLCPTRDEHSLFSTNTHFKNCKRHHETK